MDGLAWRGFDEGVPAEVGDGVVPAAPNAEIARILRLPDAPEAPLRPVSFWPEGHSRKPAKSKSKASAAAELKLILDFDGVLFNSAFEAYSVCNESVRGHPGYRQDVPFEEFLAFRAFVVDAWQYNRLYSLENPLRTFSALPAETASEADWAFSRGFFATRARIMRDPDWPRIMSPYDFFFLLKPLLLAHRERFAILSTRNVDSIRQTMAFFGADVVEIFGQEDIRRLGSKIAVAKAQGWLEPGRHLAVYVDDMNAHLEPFDGKVHLPLHANWGYDREKMGSLNPHQIITILSSLLKLAEPHA